MDDGRRWNWDGKYTGKGRLWALLSGERGQYELALANVERGMPNAEKDKLKNPAFSIQHSAVRRLDAMLNFANKGLMIPEQIWDKAEAPKNIDKQFIPELEFGEGTGSATPLAWSMAQFIRLAVNLQAGRNLDTPDVVYNRYVKNGIGGQTGFNLSSPAPDDLAKLKAGESFTVKGTAAPNSTIAYLLGEQRASVKVGADGNFVLTAKMPETETLGFLAIITPDNSSFVSMNKIGSAQVAEKLSAEIIERVKNAKTSPIIVGDKAIFIYRGAAKQVRLAGDFTGWQPRGEILQDVGENLKAAMMEFPATARVEYKIIVDGNWISDPMNPNKLDNGVGSENSFFTMPEYQATVWDRGDEIFLENIEFKSEVFKGIRLLQTYVPNECLKNSCPVLYFQDGSDYIKRAKAVSIQQNLVKAVMVKPFIMVFIDPKDRTKEYWASDDYAKFLATEVVPVIDAKYNTLKSRDGRAILGASLGGITSVWVGLKYPEVFSRIGGQSSSFWVDNERVVKELSKLDASKMKFRFYLTMAHSKALTIAAASM
jgi:enterochelin esterase-like enzyme